MAEEKLPPELVERVKWAQENHTRVQEQSLQTSVSFHEKLAVLAAGSLTLAVSGAVEFHKFPLTETSATHWLFIVLTVAAVSLWLSLVASIGHNYVETRALHESADAAFTQFTAEMFSLAAEKQDRQGDHETAAKRKLYVKNTLTKQQDQAAQRSLRLRRLEKRLSTCAVSLFVFGYLPIVVYIVALCHFE
jgi:hypothetical protein